MKNPVIKYLSLCESRHEMPKCVQGSIFPRIVDGPADIEGLKRRISIMIRDVDILHLFVTGLTVAVTEVVNYCNENEIKLVLWHYNPETGDYYQQDMYAVGKAAKRARSNNANYTLERALASSDDERIEYCNITDKVIMLDSIKHITFANVHFINCTFAGDGTGITMYSCVFKNCRASGTVIKSKFVRCDFRGFSSDTRLQFKRCNLSGTPVTVQQYHNDIIRLDECNGINTVALDRADSLLDANQKY